MQFHKATAVCLSKFNCDRYNSEKTGDDNISMGKSSSVLNAKATHPKGTWQFIHTTGALPLGYAIVQPQPL